MSDNNLFSQHQHGFVPKKDCMSNLITCLEIWTEWIEEGYTVDVIYTDFSKAFDSVPHVRLSKKLEALGIGGKILEWIKGFLKDRKQQVKVDGVVSEWKEVISGIPQGSVLGPTLFVMFINDMPDVTESICKLFADDAKLFGQVHLS